MKPEPPAEGRSLAPTPQSQECHMAAGWAGAGGGGEVVLSSVPLLEPVPAASSGSTLSLIHRAACSSVIYTAAAAAANAPERQPRAAAADAGLMPTADRRHKQHDLDNENMSKTDSHSWELKSKRRGESVSLRRSIYCCGRTEGLHLPPH